MSARNYGQACSVARFLDQLGSRWTLLIVRDLLVGPRRFKELLANSPSMGPNLLTGRLQELQEHGIIKKVAAPGDSATTYVLTGKGLELEPVVLAMARWGMRYATVDESNPGANRPDLLVVAFRAAFVPERAKGIKETYEFRIDDTIFFAQINDAVIHTGLGTANRPAFVLTTDSQTFGEIAAGALDVVDAQERCLIDVSGDEQAFARFLDMFSG
jgi:DNA-binding HxlR family transcriptional regulator